MEKSSQSSIGHSPLLTSIHHAERCYIYSTGRGSNHQSHLSTKSVSYDNERQAKYVNIYTGTIVTQMLWKQQATFLYWIQSLLCGKEFMLNTVKVC